MTYQVLADDGTPLDAHFDVEGNTLIFHSRGGSKGIIMFRPARGSSGDVIEVLRLLHASMDLPCLFGASDQQG